MHWRRPCSKYKMHEFSIASAIVEKVLGFCEEQRAKKVIEVRVTIGEFTHIDPEQLRFCFQAITKETPLEEAALEIETSDAAVHCPHCGYAGPPKYWDGALSGVLIPTLQCPVCEKAVDPAEGHECTIKTVKFVREEDDHDFARNAA